MKKTKVRVEVKRVGTGARVIARLFSRADEAELFFNNTCSAMRQRANRDQVAFIVTMQVVEPRPARVVSLVEELFVLPARR